MNERMLELAKQAGYGIQIESHNGSEWKKQIWGGQSETNKVVRLIQLTEEQQQERIEKLEEQLKIVSGNLRRGLSKSMQKLQARCIDEVLEGNYE